MGCSLPLLHPGPGGRHAPKAGAIDGRERHPERTDRRHERCIVRRCDGERLCQLGNREHRDKVRVPEQVHRFPRQNARVQREIFEQELGVGVRCEQRCGTEPAVGTQAGRLAGQRKRRFAPIE